MGSRLRRPALSVGVCVRSVQGKGVLTRAYFIALIMNEDLLSPLARTTNTGIRYLNYDAVERQKVNLRQAGSRGRTMMEKRDGVIVYC